MKRASINQVRQDKTGDYLIIVQTENGGWRTQGYRKCAVLTMNNPRVGTLVQLPGTVMMQVSKMGVIEFGRPKELVDAVFLHEYIGD